jgi:hypothetical protein
MSEKDNPNVRKNVQPKTGAATGSIAICGCAEPVGETIPAAEVKTEVIPEALTVPPVYGANSCTI